MQMSEKSLPAGNSDGDVIIIDTFLDTIGAAEQVRMKLGSVVKASDLVDVLSPEDSFRLEDFASFAPSYDDVESLSITLNGIEKYSFATVSRRSILGRTSLIITLYRDRRAYLLSKGAMAFNSNGIPGLQQCSVLIDKLRSSFRTILEKCPEEVEELETDLMNVVRNALAAIIIQNVFTGKKYDHSFFDPVEILRAAVKEISGAIPGAITRFTPSPALSRRPVISSSISSEHLWYLVTGVLSSVVSVTGHGHTVLSADRDDSRLRVTAFAPSPRFPHRMPETMSLCELKELLPDSSMRLYICELICDEYKIDCQSHCCADSFTVNFDIPIDNTVEEFHLPERSAIPKECIWLARMVLIEQ